MLEIGSPVYVRYRDHVLFKDMDPEAFSAPFIRETIGWLEGENDNSIQVVWERSAGANTPEKAKQKATGLVIMKSSILEMRKLNGRHLYRANVGINDVDSALSLIADILNAVETFYDKDGTTYRYGIIQEGDAKELMEFLQSSDELEKYYRQKEFGDSPDEQ